MGTRATTFEDSCPPPVGSAGQQDLNLQTYQNRCLELEDILSRSLPRFRRLAMRWLGNPEDAEDAVQDALLSAFKNVGRFEGRAQMSTWLVAIVINCARMQLRRRPRHQIVSLHQPAKDNGSTISDWIADTRPTPEQAWEQCELRGLVHQLIGQLPRGQQAAMQLREWHGLSTNEAAEALGIPVGTLKAQLARGRSKVTQRLRKALGVKGARNSSGNSKARRKTRVSDYRRELVDTGMALPVVDFEELGFKQQGGIESRVGA